jgi:hypothetical protein
LKTPKFRRALAKVVFWAWAPIAIAIGATLMLGHWYTLPRPTTADSSLAMALGSLRTDDERDVWLATHVLYSECRCSGRILTHLFERGPLHGVAEKILLVGANVEYERRGRAAGFAVKVVSARELADEFHVQAVPLLVVQDPSNGVQYLGGYTDRKQGPDIRDTSVIRDLIAGQKRRELPLFGCAVSEKLQALLDPLGIRYSRSEEGVR